MILCMDIGGTAVKLALIDGDGRIGSRHEAATCVRNYSVPIMDICLDNAEDFLRCSGAKIHGVAVSATGQIDDRTGTVIGTNGKIPGYEGIPITSRCSERFGVPCCTINDANAAALGECYAGSGKGFDPVLMITLGTGVGSGIVLGGRLFGGFRGIAGELGQFPMFAGRKDARFGKRGWYEDYASASALVHRAEIESGETELNGRTVFSRAAAGDAVMLHVLDLWTDDIALGLIGFTHIFNPQCILIGGGVSAQEDLLMVPLREKVLNGVLPRFGENLEIKRASLGNDAGLLGAYAFWLNRFS